MRQELRARVQREAEFYDNRHGRRAGFRVSYRVIRRIMRPAAALAYLNSGIGWKRRNEAMCEVMRDAPGKRVLEIGSKSWEWYLIGHGYRPAQLTCINVSQAELDIGRARATEFGIRSDFYRMDAHDLQFDDASFDIVYGVAILHHLEFAHALREIHRVLRIGGKIAFVEPLRHNPVARLLRWLTPHARTSDELPLGRSELRLIDRNFETDNYYCELFTVPGAIMARLLFRNPDNPLTRICDRIDKRLVRTIPAAGPYYRSVVIRGTKHATRWQN
jgi:SAM-dependent methyltransferase